MPLPFVDASFVQDEPLTADDFNAVVDGTVALAKAWPSEHDDDGKHAGTKFEKAVVLFRWDGSDYIVHDYHGPIYPSVSSHPDGGWALEVVLDQPYSDAHLWGLLATPERSSYVEAQKISEDLDLKDLDYGVIWVRSAVNPLPTHILVRVLGVPE